MNPDSVKKLIYNDREEAILKELDALAAKYNIPSDVLVRHVQARVPTLADYDDAHTSLARQNLQQRGLDNKDATRVVTLAQKLATITEHVDNMESYK